MRPGLDLLDECLAKLQGLKTDCPSLVTSPIPDVPIMCLDLRRIRSTSFVTALRQRPLANNVHDALLVMYERVLERLKNMYSAHFVDVQQRWGSTRHRVLPQIQRLFEQRCMAAARDLQQAILDLVDERLKSYETDANASSSDGHRGHSAHALAILENAFEHAPNITQAEKYKLAEATGLQPRQVTIWFQNRRNRRSNSRRTTITEPGVISGSRDIPPAPKLEPPPSPRHTSSESQTSSPNVSGQSHESNHVKIEDPLSLDSDWNLPGAGDPFAFEVANQQTLGVTPPSPVMTHVSSSQMGQSTSEVDPRDTAQGPTLTLDQLLDMDNAQQCLVFSPLDSLPRLDFDDLELNVPALEQWLGLPCTSGVTSLHVPPLSAGALHVAALALSSPFQLSNELHRRGIEEGWSMPVQVSSLRPYPHSMQSLHDEGICIEGTLTQSSPLPQSGTQPAVLPSTSCPWPSPMPTCPTSLPNRWHHDLVAPAMLAWDPTRTVPSTFV